jgi:hypothetical protein
LHITQLCLVVHQHLGLLFSYLCPVLSIKEHNIQPDVMTFMKGLCSDMFPAHSEMFYSKLTSSFCSPTTVYRDEYLLNKIQEIFQGMFKSISIVGQVLYLRRQTI